MEKAIWVKCKGEAHDNPLIDNCVMCAPFWEEYPVCPANHANPVKLNEKGYCWVCARHFDISEKMLPINHLRLFDEGSMFRRSIPVNLSEILRGRLK